MSGRCIIKPIAMEKKDKDVLSDLGPNILEGLNIATVLPYLVKYNLTTSEEKELLLSSSITNIDKKKLLIYSWLPHKGCDSLSRFMKALNASINEEPTHEELASKLQAKRLEGFSFLHKSLV